MPGTIASDGPTVSLSFANNFWGKEDAGVSPLLERMHNAKVTGDELKAFYTARAQIEEEYSRKLLNLARKPLGSSEAGTLRMSLDVLRGEVEAMGKSHQNIAGQMKSELEEPLSAMAGGLKERRKIIQTGIEKLLKTKTQQTTAVNKARDRYEQDCLKIKGYLAQGHMVMGQEERKNKAKLEKTQIQMSATSQEYEQAVKILEETTGRWNREWKAACDKFQDLEEERLDFTKSSLWSFANIASTVCVSDDASCEKVRLSLEDCDVEKDISTFIKEQGTGQEIPDPPKYINFCRGDINDNASEASDDGAYSVAQFQRTMNPVFRTSSPQPSNYSSHHDPSSALAQDFGRQSVGSERNPSQPPVQADPLRSSQSSRHQDPYAQIAADIPKIPHNEYPMDGMTQFCRMGPPSERSSIPSPTRPESRDDTSDYSNPTSLSSFEPSSGHQSPVKQYNGSNVSATSERPERPELKQKRSGFFQNHSPFRRKSKHEKDTPQPSAAPTPTQRNTWAPSARPATQGSSPSRPFARESRNIGFGSAPSSSPGPDPEPVDPRANFQLNIGNNVFDVASPDSRKKPALQKEPSGELDPIAQALAELKGVTKQASMRVSADRYHGLSTPAPPGTPGLSGRASPNPHGRASPNPLAGSDLRAAQRGTPPPSYDQPVSRLGAPQPAFTSKQMRQTTANYVTQKQDMFSPSGRQGGYDQRGQAPSQVSSRPSTREGRGSDVMRATSPAPMRSTSPRPYMDAGHRGHSQQQPMRATSPNPYGPGNPSSRPRAQSSSPVKPHGNYSGYNSHGGSPAQQMPRAASPNPQFRGGSSMGSNGRPPSSRGSDGGMALQLAPAGDGRGSQRRPVNGGSAVRPTSQYYGADGGWAAAASSASGPVGAGAGVDQVSTRVRSQSAAGQRQVTKDGRPILHYSRAMYMYQAAIPEELSFAKGDVLAVLRLQDDGWWEAEVMGKGKNAIVRVPTVEEDVEQVASSREWRDN
ncbi:hypothetical protein MBLNU459_g1093t3 [Dothideomycetes sp. NU459]